MTTEELINLICNGGRLQLTARTIVTTTKAGAPRTITTPAIAIYETERSRKPIKVLTPGDGEYSHAAILRAIAALLETATAEWAAARRETADAA